MHPVKTASQIDLLSYPVERIREDFPILRTKMNEHPLCYFDNGATTQKPYSVISALTSFYENTNANAHRGVYTLTETATEQYEDTRKKVQNFINAQHAHECVFVRGTTEAINIVANGFARAILQPGDEIITTQLEHHANIVPWQMVCEQTGAILKVVPATESGELDIEAFTKLLCSKTKLVTCGHVSNALGTIHDIKKIIELAHSNDTPVLIDGAQAAPHIDIDVKDLDCDFYAFSGHKMYAPTGIGVLYGKTEWLNKLPPLLYGGEMVGKVTLAKTTLNDLPFKFEGGTGSIADTIALGAAIDYLNNLNIHNIAEYESFLLKTATESFSQVKDLKIIGEAPNKAPVISFLLGDTTPRHLGEFLSKHGIAIRTGRHCAEPAMDSMGITSTARVSFGLYNTVEEIQKFVEVLDQYRAE